MPDPKTISSTSQNFLDIYDIINDIVILKNGSASVILTVNAMNFGLLAEQEQDAVIYAYAGLLNSINYPIQILIQSQTKDASSYLNLLDERVKKTKDKLKQSWIRRYSKFVSDLIRERNVLDKKFFVIIPASSLEMGLTPTQDLISGFKEQSIDGVEKSVILEKAKNLLDPKRDHMIAQFNRIGLYAKQLSTEEIIRLFYTNYNPEASEGQQITNSENYTTALVQAQIRGNYMNDQVQDSVQPTDMSSTTQPEPTPATTPAADPVAPTIDPVAPATPVQPVAEVAENNSAPVGVNISESPVLQKPAVANVSPATTPVAPSIDPVAPVAPAMPTPTAPTIDPVAPAMPAPAANPMPTPTMPTPTPAAPAVSTPVENASADGAVPSVDSTQENINETINQMTEKPTQ
ncbi:MAG: hypothetical protein HN846_03445 [Candidatus Pacebacteria bacterium]|jgi:hypothetical protein|nr:hypothetical protein [Candidatus Paceibacterota bacterium]MBT3512128.1 hypothetical protein [Candidatus Paceibacterota bacterium]MBT4005410.1 hypothetical protein [Candidatus Paceibacterota bacterium]MBT4359119.1 hypothetical protein [Candidatus Paceibacterota bacterium]MBT4680964.1 hypothetical protein [Candidatus Paceibacterota bacterium]